MNMKTMKNKILYVLLLMVGFAGQILSGMSSISFGTGFFTLIWIYAFLELVCRFHSKKELIPAGVLFVVGYTLKFAGSTGSSWMDIGLFGIFGLALYAVFCVSAYFMRRWDKFWGTLLFPLCWMLEYLLATVLRFPVLVRVDMMFADLNVLMHAERLIGSLGFSFVIIWMISLLRFAAAHRNVWYALLSFGLFLALLTPGLFYLYPNMETPESIRAAYTTGPYGGDFIDYTAPSYEVSEESLRRSVRDAAAQQAEILVFNEEAFELDDSDEERFIQECASLAAENSIAVLLGLDVRDTDGSEGGKSLNKIVMFGTDGTILSSYQKAKLIPVLESGYERGDGNIPSDRIELNEKSIKIAYLICYDSNFPAYVRQIEPDTDLLLLPSWDWSAVTELHAKLCRTIAVENDIYILKPTYDGISVAIDPSGQIFHKSTTDETGYEQIQLVDIPIKSASVPAEAHTHPSAFVHAIIGTDILSIPVCLILLAANLVLNSEKTKRSFVFSLMLITNIIACGADALSWLLDGHTRLNSVVFCSTFLAMVLTIVLIWEFVVYLYEYIREREEVSPVSVNILTGITGVILVITVIMSLNGDLFSVADAVYSDGPLYTVYVLMNIGMMVYAIVTVAVFQRLLTYTDRVAAYAYLLIPTASAAINIFVPEWSFAYPATALTMLLIYTMIQSDRMDRLEHEGTIVSYHVTHDELTGLFNRRAFEDRRARLKETGGACGVIFSDLNGLKYANDHFGHVAGDQLLIRFAGILTGVFRQNEIFRISGDEFVCMMENIDEKVFFQRVHGLEARIGQDSPPITALGAAFGAGHDIDDLIKDAESKMYVDKKAIHERFPYLTR